MGARSGGFATCRPAVFASECILCAVWEEPQQQSVACGVLEVIASTPREEGAEQAAVTTEMNLMRPSLGGKGHESSTDSSRCRRVDFIPSRPPTARLEVVLNEGLCVVRARPFEHQPSHPTHPARMKRQIPLWLQYKAPEHMYQDCFGLPILQSGRSTSYGMQTAYTCPCDGFHRAPPAGAYGGMARALVAVLPVASGRSADERQATAAPTVRRVRPTATVVTVSGYQVRPECQESHPPSSPSLCPLWPRLAVGTAAAARRPAWP